MKQQKETAALVTGSSSGIGKELTKLLLELGYYVYGIGQTFSDPIISDKFCPIEFDLSKTTKIPDLIRSIQKQHTISILINNAGIGYFGLHEELNAAKIHNMVSVNLEAPLILTQLLLRDLKKTHGHLIQISSITAKKSNPHGCAYGATKAALTSFSNSLYDEARKYGVKVTCIHPDMTKSNFYRHSNFREGENPESFIMPSEIAETVRFLLSQRDGLVLSDITILPQKHQLSK